MKFSVFLALAILAFFPFYAGAQEISGNFQNGSVRTGYDTSACNSARDGALRYSSSTKKFQFCHGATSTWTSYHNVGVNTTVVGTSAMQSNPTAASCTAPSCPSGYTSVGCANGQFTTSNSDWDNYVYEAVTAVAFDDAADGFGSSCSKTTSTPTAAPYNAVACIRLCAQ